MSEIGSINFIPNPVLSSRKGLELSLTSGDWIENSYRHEIRAMGGFWSAEVRINGELDKLRTLMFDLLGHQAESFAYNGQKAWEGFVNSVELRVPGMQVSLSLDSMANKVWARYSTSASQKTGSSAQRYNANAGARGSSEGIGDGNALRGALSESEASQERYGIKEHVIAGGILTSSNVADQVAGMYLREHAFPEPSIRFASNFSDPRFATLDINCLGYFHTLYWRRYNQTSNTGTQEVSALIDDVASSVGQFIASTDLDLNTTLVPEEYDTDREAADVILDVANLGSNDFARWVIGVYENRVLRLRKIN